MAYFLSLRLCTQKLNACLNPVNAKRCTYLQAQNSSVPKITLTNLSHHRYDYVKTKQTEADSKPFRVEGRGFFVNYDDFVPTANRITNEIFEHQIWAIFRIH